MKKLLTLVFLGLASIASAQVRTLDVDSNDNAQVKLACNASAAITVTAGNTTQLVALVTGQKIYVCGFVITTPAAGTAQFLYSTGGSCASTTAITGTLNLATNGSIAFGTGQGTIFATAVSNALCLSAVTGNVNGVVSYIQQ